MLGVVLMILKTLGLLLLGLLGFFLVLVLFLLLVPVPYRVWLSGGTGSEYEFSFRIKVFGIQIYPVKKTRKHRKMRRQDKELPDMDEKASDSFQKSDDGKNVDSQQTAVSQLQDTPQTQDGQQKTSLAEPSEQKSKNKQRKHRSDSQGKEKNASVKDLRSMLKLIHNEVMDESNRRAVSHVFSEVRYLIRHFGPRRIRADAAFSLGDPANTGYLTAILSICPFVYGEDCRILPDFEADGLYLQGWLDVGGHVRMMHVFRSGLRLLFDRDIQKIIRKIIKKK